MGYEVETEETTCTAVDCVAHAVDPRHLHYLIGWPALLRARRCLKKRPPLPRCIDAMSSAAVLRRSLPLICSRCRRNYRYTPYP